jgi:hypothetical protein
MSWNGRNGCLRRWRAVAVSGACAAAALLLWGAEGENAGEWSGRGLDRRFEGELEAPRGELAGAWPPRGERGLLRSGDERGHAGAGGREGGRAGRAEVAARRGSGRGRACGELGRLRLMGQK